MPSKSISTGTWTGANGEVLSSTTTTVEAIPYPGVACPTDACTGEVEAWPGASSGWFTGRREYYSTFHVVCSKCGRQGFPAFYQGEEHRDFALKEGLRQFLERDSRPRIVITDVNK
jgi:hypothetical protein